MLIERFSTFCTVFVKITWLVTRATKRVKLCKNKIFLSETIREMKLILSIHVYEISDYINCVFLFQSDNHLKTAINQSINQSDKNSDRYGVLLCLYLVNSQVSVYTLVLWLLCLN